MFINLVMIDSYFVNILYFNTFDTIYIVLGNKKMFNKETVSQLIPGQKGAFHQKHPQKNQNVSSPRPKLESQ